MSRELQAWDWAEEVLQDYPELVRHRNSFVAYRASCLTSYQEGLKEDQKSCEQLTHQPNK